MLSHHHGCGVSEVIGHGCECNSTARKSRIGSADTKEYGLRGSLVQRCLNRINLIIVWTGLGAAVAVAGLR